jgi:nitric oxide reductase large subunit
MNLHNIKDTINSPKVKEIFKQMKPDRTIWGFISVLLLFIVPEIVSFIYGDEIVKWCQSKQTPDLPYMESYMYENIADLLGEGSWFNLAIGFAFLIWLFF